MTGTRRRATPVPPWTGSPWVRTSHHGGRERRVTVFRVPPDRGGGLARLAALAVGAAVWAAVTYPVAVLANRRLELGFVESVRDADFQLVLMACGLGVWVVAGLPVVLGAMAVRALRDRILADLLEGTVVFRGAFDPRRSYDDNRRVEYYVAVDDGSSDRVPAYRCDPVTVMRLAEGDVVRASVTRTGVRRVLHLVVVTPLP